LFGVELVDKKTNKNKEIKMSSNIIEKKSGLIEVSEELIMDYLKSLGNNLSEQHIKKFVHIAKAFQLNPFIREIYGIPFSNNFNIIVGYEVYIKRAERSGMLGGWKAWTEGSGAELKGCIEIKRKDWEQPFYHEVYFDEYNQNNSMWKSKPRTMIKKVAIAQGFRLAFPVELGGIPYTADEIDITSTTDGGTPIETTIETEVANANNEDTTNNVVEALKQLGLETKEKNGWIAVNGNTYGKNETLKSLGFKWYSEKKVWARKVA
jgi:phage recombination protein Bet